MNLMNSLLLMLGIVSIVAGLMIVLARTNVISFKKASVLKTLYAVLTISLLLLVTGFTAKFLSSDEGKKWLDSFSSNGDCDKIDRPYWCDL